jgi:hypothetical protein
MLLILLSRVLCLVFGEFCCMSEANQCNHRLLQYHALRNQWRGGEQDASLPNGLEWRCIWTSQPVPCSRSLAPADRIVMASRGQGHDRGTRPNDHDSLAADSGGKDRLAQRHTGQKHQRQGGWRSAMSGPGDRVGRGGEAPTLGEDVEESPRGC